MDDRFLEQDGAKPGNSLNAGVAGLHPRGEPEKDNMAIVYPCKAKQFTPKRAQCLWPTVDANYVAYLFTGDPAGRKESFTSVLAHAPCRPHERGQPIHLDRGGVYWLLIEPLDEASEDVVYRFMVIDAAATPRNGPAYDHIQGYDPLYPGRFGSAGVELPGRALRVADVGDGYARAKCGRLWACLAGNAVAGLVEGANAFSAIAPSLIIYPAGGNRRKMLDDLKIHIVNAALLTAPVEVFVIHDAADAYISGGSGAAPDPANFSSESGAEVADFLYEWSINLDHVVAAAPTVDARTVFYDYFATVPDRIPVDCRRKPQIGPVGSLLVYVVAGGAVAPLCVITADVAEENA